MRDSRLTDFRVPVPTDPDEGITRELDWERDLGRWTRSEKEDGDVRWVQNLKPSTADLDFLRTFFRIEQAIVSSVLMQLSPGELTLLHSNGRSDKHVLAALCPQCGGHWIVYIREEDANWYRYGRNCDYKWSRGDWVNAGSDEVLDSLLASEGRI